MLAEVAGVQVILGLLVAVAVEAVAGTGPAPHPWSPIPACREGSLADS